MNKKERQVFLDLYNRLEEREKKEQSSMDQATVDHKPAHVTLYKHTKNRVTVCKNALGTAITNSGNNLKEWQEEFKE